MVINFKIEFLKMQKKRTQEMRYMATINNTLQCSNYQKTKFIGFPSSQKKKPFALCLFFSCILT